MKTPFKRAWDKFEKDNAPSFESPAVNPYLTNRIYRAFSDGWNAAWEAAIVEALRKGAKR